MNDDPRLIRAALDLDLADRGRTHPAIEGLANRDVFMQPVDVVLLFEPAAVPSAGDAQPHADRMNLLSHLRSLRARRPFLAAARFLTRRLLRCSRGGGSSGTARRARSLHRGAGALAARLSRRRLADDHG